MILEQMEEMFQSDGSLTGEADHQDQEFALHEACLLAQALVCVWYKERCKRFLEEYNVLAAEQEVRSLIYENDEYQVWLMSRHDAICERRSDGALIQYELKTKASINKNWIDSWEHSFQLMGQQFALAQWAKQNGLQDRPIAGAYIEALLKGMRKRDDSGIYRQETPLIYAYVKPGDDLLVKDVFSPSYRKGWSKQLIDKYMSIEDWVLRELPSEITALKAVVVPPLRPSAEEMKDILEQWAFAVIADYEHNSLMIEFPQYKQMMMNKFFGQNTEHCFSYGKCHFYDMCFNEQVQQDPIGSGIYQVREPNHPEGEDA